jgi:hypothetical protein
MSAQAATVEATAPHSRNTSAVVPRGPARIITEPAVLTLEKAFGRQIMPIGSLRKVQQDVPGA